MCHIKYLVSRKTALNFAVTILTVTSHSGISNLIHTHNSAMQCLCKYIFNCKPSNTFPSRFYGSHRQERPSVRKTEQKWKEPNRESISANREYHRSPRFQKPTPRKIPCRTYRAETAGRSQITLPNRPMRKRHT